MSKTTLEQLKALTAKTPAQKDALHREDDALCGKYPKHHVAYIDAWNGEELTRTVVAAAVECGDFQAQLAKLPPDVRARCQLTHIPDPDMVDVPSVWFE